ncbi:ABC transporter ATP-binding protein [Asticcacaulis excentricus]|uniref:ABC transporter related protein n=1 Tax=Asticcacaulis excentricus (strain ATCC 15261 / DSM 4724 / KCTC 12464 / NCIMB 9791 / VKM B-1370 / CB 48) TaxID=573065 RepID=E8RQ91_ASTEC|nr:ABC transporter ATP-binding protein [Asticcacaulis excentricus]ADU13193.1 ABC transporter related protein [Asticcacaulis excentricus CB 48]
MTEAPAPVSAPPTHPLVIEGLRNQFGANIVHDNLDLTVDRGKVMGVVGGSGTGKTVLLNSILGLQKPSKGAIHLFGKDITKLSEKQLRLTQSRFGVLFQSGALFSALSVIENVCVPLTEYAKLKPAQMREVGLMKMALAGLPLDAADKRPSELSGGMIKRTALARALVLDPELLFLDEPTAGLDPIGAAAFDALIRELSDSLNLTVFMITHDLDSLYAICDEVAVLADKRVVAQAPPKVLEQSDHPWIHEYFNGPRGRSSQSRGTGDAS